jgi:hypothetical protein
MNCKEMRCKDGNELLCPVTSFGIVTVESSGSGTIVHIHETGSHEFLLWSWQDVAN